MIVTALGTLYLVLTFRQTRRSADAAVSAASEARRSAAAAEAALVLSRDLSRMQVRPVVHHKRMRARYGGVGESGSLAFELQNSGATIAVDLESSLMARIADWPLPPGSMPLPEAPHWTQPTLTPPGSSHVVRAVLPEWDTATADLSRRYLKALLVTLRLRYRGDDGYEYAHVSNLVCVGEPVLDGTFIDYDPAADRAAAEILE